MKKSAFTIFAFMIAGLFLAGILYFIVSLSIQNTHADINTRSDFKSLTDAIKTVLDSSNSANSNVLEKIVQNRSTLSYLKITKGSNEIFRWSKDDNISTFAHTHNGNFTLDNGENINLEAVFWTLLPEDIFRVARTSFVIILIGVLLAIIILVFICLDTDNSIDDDYDSFSLNDGNSIIQDEIALDSIPEDTSNNIDTNKEDDNTSSQEYAPQEESENEVEIPNKDDSSQEEQKKEEINDFELKENEILEENASVDTRNSKKSTNRTEFLPEEYMLQRLGNELERASASLQDIAFMLFDIVNVKHSDEMAPTIENELLNTFRYQDMVFFYKETGYAVIVPDTTLDVALKQCEDLQAVLVQKLKDAYIDTQVLVGVSAKNIRTLDANRMFNEALQALNHADAESPIVAFRVDPEKFRQFLGAN